MGLLPDSLWPCLGALLPGILPAQPGIPTGKLEGLRWEVQPCPTGFRNQMAHLRSPGLESTGCKGEGGLETGGQDPLGRGTQLAEPQALSLRGATFQTEGPAALCV